MTVRDDRNLLEPWIEDALAGCTGRSILVDGFNVLHAAILRGRRGRDWWSAETREPLLERVSGWPEPADLVWVVFDGAESSWAVRLTPKPDAGSESGARSGSGPRVHVVFARSADDWIVRRARRAPDPTRLVVVSADREVTGRARSAGCEVLGPRAFVARCEPGAAPIPAEAQHEALRDVGSQSPASERGAAPGAPSPAGELPAEPLPPRRFAPPPSPKADS